MLNAVSVAIGRVSYNTQRR